LRIIDRLVLPKRPPIVAAANFGVLFLRIATDVRMVIPQAVTAPICGGLTRMWFIDFPTLVLIIVAGVQLGVQGFFGFDTIGHIFGENEKFAFMVIGLSAVWQFFRQRFH
jgi:uncharacterized membrane protein YuzA (DUF378 family)